MRIDQIEFLKKNLERAAFAMHHVKPYANDKEREKNEIKDGINKIQEALSSITSVGEMFLGVLLDDMKAEDGLKKVTDISIQEVNGADVFVLDEKGDVKQILRPEKPKDEEAWVIPFCIGELEKLNKKLTEYTPFNPELKKLTIEEVIYKLSLEMQIQNHVLMTALRHLMGETEK